MFGKKKNPLNNHVDTLIGINTHITGDIRFSGGLRIDGHIAGNVIATDDEAQSTLVLSDAGSIRGEVKVAHVVINGTVTGPIHAQSYLEIQSKAKIHGDIHYGSLEIQQGALVEGRMIHHNKQEHDNNSPIDSSITSIPPTLNKQSISSESDAI